MAQASGTFNRSVLITKSDTVNFDGSTYSASAATKAIPSDAIFVGGAIGVELATEPFLYNDELDTLAYNLWTPVEEGMEMGGVIFFLSALFDYLKSSFRMEFNATPNTTPKATK